MSATIVSIAYAREKKQIHDHYCTKGFINYEDVNGKVVSYTCEYCDLKKRINKNNMLEEIVELDLKSEVL